MEGWQLALEICGIIGGIATLMAFLLGPMFYVASKITDLRKELSSEMNGFSEEIRSDMREFRSDMNEFRQEIKDFHGRLIALKTKKEIEKK